MASIISIKPVSRGLWPKDVKKTYEWWYRPLEEQNEYQLAMDWVLSQPGMVTTVPSSFLDVFEHTVTAARKHRGINAAETGKLKELAANCLPIFKNEEKKAAASFILPSLPGYPSRGFRI